MINLFTSRLPWLRDLSIETSIFSGHPFVRVMHISPYRCLTFPSPLCSPSGSHSWKLSPLGKVMLGHTDIKPAHLSKWADVYVLELSCMYVYGTPSSTLHGRDTKNVAAYVTKAFYMVAICLLPTISLMIHGWLHQKTALSVLRGSIYRKVGYSKKKKKQQQQRKWPTCLTKLCGPIRPLLPTEPTGNYVITV